LFNVNESARNFKRNNTRRVPRRGKRSKGQANGQMGIGRTSMVVPRPVVTSYKIRRAWTQQIDYNPATGWFSGGGPNLQIGFAGSVNEIKIGGVSTFGPTLINSSEFSALFDQWRINSVTLRFDWNNNAYSPVDLASTAPLLYYAPDYDSLEDASVTALLQYPSCRTHSFLQNGYTPLIFTMSPKPLRDIAGTGVLTSYAVDNTKPFIRTTELTTPYYGFKLATLPFGGTTSQVSGRVLITCYVDLEFINPK